MGDADPLANEARWGQIILKWPTWGLCRFFVPKGQSAVPSRGVHSVVSRGLRPGTEAPVSSLNESPSGTEELAGGALIAMSFHETLRDSSRAESADNRSTCRVVARYFAAGGVFSNLSAAEFMQ